MIMAIRIHETGGPEVMRWEGVEVGRPGPGEARVRHTAVGLNFIDVYHRSGLYKLPLPAVPGSEGAGVVEEVGPGVTEVKAGDRVAYAGVVGAYSQVRLVRADRLVPLPEDIEDGTAAAMMLKGMTAQYLLRRTCPVQRGDVVLIHAAAGGVGLIACQWAKHLGATVIGTVSTDEKAALARGHGCDHPIVTSREELRRARQGDHRRTRRAGGVRLGGEGHVRGLPRLPAADGDDGLVREQLRAGGADLPAGAVGQGLAVPHPSHPDDLHRPAGGSTRDRRGAVRGCALGRGEGGDPPRRTRSRRRRRPTATWRRGERRGRRCFCPDDPRPAPPRSSRRG